MLTPTQMQELRLGFSRAAINLTCLVNDYLRGGNGGSRSGIGG